MAPRRGKGSASGRFKDCEKFSERVYRKGGNLKIRREVNGEEESGGGGRNKLRKEKIVGNEKETEKDVHKGRGA